MDPEFFNLSQRVVALENELADLHYLVSRKTGLGSADIKGRIASSSSFPANSIPSSAIQAAAITKTKLSYEQVTLAFGSADTSKTATITSGSIIDSVYASVVTSTPAYGELQLSISGTTLTGTRSAAPGGAAAITYTITLLKA